MTRKQFCEHNYFEVLGILIFPKVFSESGAYLQQLMVELWNLFKWHRCNDLDNAPFNRWSVRSLSWDSGHYALNESLSLWLSVKLVYTSIWVSEEIQLFDWETHYLIMAHPVSLPVIGVNINICSLNSCDLIVPKWLIQPLGRFNSTEIHILIVNFDWWNLACLHVFPPQF